MLESFYVVLRRRGQMREGAGSPDPCVAESLVGGSFSYLVLFR
jgi:hypothetical protein